MKSLNREISDFEKAKSKMEASKARYEADLKKYKKAEASRVEAENMEIVKVIRELNVDISDIEKVKKMISDNILHDVNL